MEYAALLERFVKMSRRVLGDALTGIYLHGSAALGCFDAQRSDLDLILVTETAPADAQKLAFLQELLVLDAEAPPKGFELSIVQRSVCAPFLFPTPYEFHFSHGHLALARRDPQTYLRTLRGTDIDLAAHFTVIRACGIVLYGAPVSEVFAPVPRKDYLASILADVENAEEDIRRDPVYITLNLCRVLAAVREGAVLSKREGGEWGLRNLPQEYHTTMQNALNYYNHGTALPLDADPVDFARYMKEALR